jgi:DNA invertase Pin-like site-specific DNA recombinase|tara:strand:- start:706 stop:1488 length:783 start_codon:yes stop_codon:yes gene_type:complete
MPKVYAYLRVSKDEQSLNGESLDDQAARAMAYFDLLKTLPTSDSGLEWGGFFFEKGESAWKTRLVDREEGRRLNKSLERDDHVVFLRMDRAFRSVQDFTTTLPAWEQRGVTIHFIDQSVNLATPNGKFFANVLVAVAQWESDIKSLRNREAAAKRKSEGRMNTRQPPIGYMAVGKRNVLVKDPAQISVMRLIHYMRTRHGYSFDIISDKLEDMLATRDGRKPRRRNGFDGSRPWPKDRVRRAFLRYERIMASDEPVYTDG